MTVDFPDEDIRDFIEKVKIHSAENTRYRSQFSAKVRKDLARVKSSHKSLGQSCVPLRPPSDFLKKHSRITPARPVVKHVHPGRPEFRQKLPEWTNVKVCIPDPKELPPLPKDPATEHCVNFRKRNVLKAINSAPRKPKPRLVDTVKGDAFDLKSSGWWPVYIHKKDFGKVPPVVKKRKAERAEKSKELDKIAREKRQENENREMPYGLVPDAEREKLLEDMKKKWDEKMSLFQRLPMMIDTLAKQRRKLRLEEELKQIEKDMEMVEKHRYIYVYDDE